MSAMIIQYRTHPEAAAENRRLVEAVLRAAAREDGIQYAAFQHEDGVTFVHVVAGNAGGKLERLPEFAEFRRGLESRTEPGSRTATRVDALGPAVRSQGPGRRRTGDAPAGGQPGSVSGSPNAGKSLSSRNTTIRPMTPSSASRTWIPWAANEPSGRRL